MEDPQALMHPQPEHSDFGVTVELIEDVDALNYFADVAHVEHIVGFGGSWQECLRDCLVKVYCSHRQAFCKWLDFVFELLRLEFIRENGLEDPSNLVVSREREVDKVELRQDTS